MTDPSISVTSPANSTGQAFTFVIGERTAPDRVAPEAGESLLSILTRLVRASDHDALNVLCGPIDLPSYAIESPARYVEAARDLAELCGYPVHEIESRMYLRVSDDSDDRNLRSIGGVVTRDRFLSTTRRAVSPESLRKNPYHRSIWDIVPLGFCPESMEVLIEDCPDLDCGRPLRWGGSSVTHCRQCGFDLRTATTSKVSEEDAEVLLPLAHLLSGDPAQVQSARVRLPDCLAEVPSGELLHLALMLGMAAMPSQSSVLRKQIMLGHMKGAETGLLAAGMRVLCGWPHAFDAVIDNVRDQARPIKGADPQRIELGIICDLIDPETSDLTVCALVSEALHGFFDRHVGRLKATSYPSVLLRWAHSTISAQDAAELLNATPQRVARLKRYPEFVLTGGSSGKALVFSQAAVEALKEEQSELVTLTQLAIEEKVSTKLLRGLVEAGFVATASAQASLIYQTPDTLVNRTKWRETRSRIEMMSCGVAGKSTELRVALAQAGGTAEVWIDVLKHLLTGRLRVTEVREGEEAIGNRWQIDKAEVLSLLNSQALGADVRPLSEACRELGLKPTPANHLAKHGHIETTVETIGGFKYLVSESAMAEFKINYVLSTELSDRFGMTAKAIKAWLNKEGLQEIQYTKWDIPLVFVRRDVEDAISKIAAELSHLSDQAAAGKVAWIRYLDLPTESKACELQEAAASSLFDGRRRSLLGIADLLCGYSPHEVAERHAVSLATVLKEWIPAYRKNGLSAASTRRLSARSLLNLEQRLEFEEFARNVIHRMENGERDLSINTIITYVQNNFGITYHKATVRQRLAYAGIKWPKRASLLAAASNV